MKSSAQILGIFEGETLRLEDGPDDGYEREKKKQG